MYIFCVNEIPFYQNSRRAKPSLLRKSMLLLHTKDRVLKRFKKNNTTCQTLRNCLSIYLSVYKSLSLCHIYMCVCTRTRV